MAALLLMIVVALVPRALGTMEGEVGYPACSAPEGGVEVCAELENGGSTVCTKATLAGHYRLAVAPGAYRVYAKADLVLPGYRAYYNSAVLCGLKVGCADRTPLIVRVRAGRLIRNVNPADWFTVPPELRRLRRLRRAV